MQVIPLSAIASQALSVGLGSAIVDLDIYQKSTGLFADITVNDATILTGVICLTGARLVQDAYLGFPGDLMFIDMQASVGEPGRDYADPDYTGLGDRFVLLWLEPGDY